MSELLEQYLDHARRYPAPVLEQALLGILSCSDRADVSWETGAEVAAEVRRAIVEARPYCVLRVGDGTGNFLGYEDPAHAELKRHSIETILTMTFGTSEFSKEQVTDIAEGLITGIRSADILGVSDEFRLGRLRVIDTELTENVDLRGFSGSRESYVAMEALLKRERIRPPMIVTNHIHRFLAPHVDNLLQGLKSVCVIGPYDLEASLKQRFGFETVKTYLIPNQNSSSGEGSAWFPDHYEWLWNELDPGRDGQVYLVAAGLLAKPLSARIKALGGVALDIGSMIDVWAGRSVRKYHDDQFLAAHSL